jgi:hypothetical protein
MPPVLQGNVHYKSQDPQFQKDFDYTYPEVEGKELNLKPGSKLHNKIRDEVMERAHGSARVMSTRFDSWNKIDETLTAYIRPDEKEKAVQERDDRRPISIVYPYSYTVMETLLSYFVAAFLQDPIFRYEGTGPEDVIGAILMEKVVALHCNKTKVGLALHTQARDSFAYGFGVTTPTWTRQYGKKTVKNKDVSLLGKFLGGQGTTEVIDDALLFEGNALENVDPYLYLPDPHVAIHEVQKGEFVGWVQKTNYMKLMEEEQGSEDLRFNTRYVNAFKGRRTSVIYGANVTGDDITGRNTKTGMNTQNYYGTDTKSTPTDVVKMFITLIPKDWELGESEYPEKWFFAVAADEVVIEAHPTGLDHNQYPVSVIAPDFDGYTTTPVSRIEILYGLQGVLDFLFNSHVANVRKAINDMIIYDPYLVNSKDLKNPAPGKLIRLRRPAWGRGVKDVAQQLAVNDVTRGNIADSSWIIQGMDKVSGADDSIKGSLRTGGPERLTGTEFEGTRAGAISRLERIAKVIGMQGIQDIGQFFGHHTQQFMTEETYVKVSGNWQPVLEREFAKELNRGRISVDPMQLSIQYDVMVRDGSVPGSNFSGAWIQLFNILGSNPELAQKFDVVRIFTHIARNLGAKNVNDFVRRGGNMQPQLESNENVAAQVQQGNLIPFTGA